MQSIWYTTFSRFLLPLLWFCIDVIAICVLNNGFILCRGMSTFRFSNDGNIIIWCISHIQIWYGWAFSICFIKYSSAQEKHWQLIWRICIYSLYIYMHINNDLIVNWRCLKISLNKNIVRQSGGSEELVSPTIFNREFAIYAK